jgi:hypothetical protein
VHACNLDNKERVAGRTLFILVHAAGALFAAGDGHGAYMLAHMRPTGLLGLVKLRRAAAVTGTRSVAK